MEPSSALVADVTTTLDRLSSPLSSIRTGAESHLHSNLLVNDPALTLLALVHIAASPVGSSPRRVQALIIFRRVALQLPTVLDVQASANRDDAPTPTHPALLQPRWETIDKRSRSFVGDRLLQTLIKSDMRPDTERHALCDTIAELYKANRPAPWTEFASTLSQLFSSPSPSLREACFRLYAECVDLLEAEPLQTAIQGLSTGLRDEGVNARLAAMQAASKLLQSLEPPSRIDQYAELVTRMLEILPGLASFASEDDRPLTTALLELIELASTPKLSSRIFKPHITTLTHFCISIVREVSLYDENVRASALELLVSIAETAPSLVRSTDFSKTVVPLCLQLMTEREDDPAWLKAEVIKDEEDEDTIATIAEQTLDRFAQKLGQDVFVAFEAKIGGMLEARDWQTKSAGLSGIAAIAEGCRKSMSAKLGQFVHAITALSVDPHPRVRFATIYALGQMCTDLEDHVQAEFGQDVLRVFVSNMLGEEARLQAFAAAACVNFFRSTEVDKPLRPFLPDVVRALLHLLQTGSTFVQGNALEALTIVSSYMGDQFAPYYPEIMPHLLKLLEMGNLPELEKLRAQALDCASNIAAAVDPSLFAPDAPRLLLAMQAISTSLPEDDEVTRPYLLTAFCHLAATVGAEAFAPYINETFPQLLKRASKDAEVTIGESGEIDAEAEDEGDDWETLSVDGQTVSIRTSAVDDKLEAVQNLISLVQTLGSTLPLPALQQVVQTALPLLKFVWHIGIRESAAALLAVTVQALAGHELTRDEQVFICSTCSDALAPHLASDTDSEFLATALSSIATIYTSFPARGTLTKDSRDLCIRALEGQLTDLMRREQERLSVEEGDEVEDDAEREELIAGEKEVYYGINVVIKELMKQHLEEDLTSPTSTTFPLAAFAAGMTAIGAQPTRLNAAQFGLRLWCDMLDQLGERAVSTIQPHLDRVARCLHDQDATIRRVSAYAVGLAIERAPSSLSGWATSMIEPLFTAIAAVDPSIPEQEEGDDVLAARDNAISALSKIIRHSPPTIADPLLSRWVMTLPILIDEDEFKPVYSLVIDLLQRSHPAVSSPVVATHMLKVLVQALQQSAMPTNLEEALLVELTRFVNSLPEGSEARQAAKIMPEDVRARLGRL